MGNLSNGCVRPFLWGWIRICITRTASQTVQQKVILFCVKKFKFHPKSFKFHLLKKEMSLALNPISKKNAMAFSCQEPKKSLFHFCIVLFVFQEKQEFSTSVSILTMKWFVLKQCFQRNTPTGFSCPHFCPIKKEKMSGQEAKTAESQRWEIKNTFYLAVSKNLFLNKQ